MRWFVRKWKSSANIIQTLGKKCRMGQYAYMGSGKLTTRRGCGGQLAEFSSLNCVGPHLLHRDLLELPGSSILSHRQGVQKPGAHYSFLISIMHHSVSLLKAAAYHNLSWTQNSVNWANV